MLKKITMCLAALCAASISASSSAQTFTTTRVANGVSLPLYVTAPPGDTSRLFIVEQRGLPTATSARIRILDLTTSPPTLLPTAFVTISPVSTGNEQGLLGMAFHPDYANNRSFFVNYTSGGNSIIARYKVSTTDPNVAEPTGTIILTYPDVESNHNGGWIGFGPDGYLYIATGDGGGAGDAHGAIGNGQNLSTLLGKMLRISVTDTGTYTVPSDNPYTGATVPYNTIWAWGLRNPFRCSHDRQTGELWIGDVGQNAIEEVSYQPADVNGSMGGRNYGWRCFEGNSAFNPGACGTFPPASMIYPVHQYTHAAGFCIIGGYVYRGSAIPSLQGHYFFADNSSNKIWSFQYAGVNNPPITDRTAQLAPGGGLSITQITSFGEDAAGELYIVDRAGEVFKIIPGAPVNDTCANAVLVGNGSTNFTSASATTDGPDEGVSCFSGPTQILNDVWYKYLATCDGNATVSLCGATFDTRLAVYGNCPAGPGQLLGCNDNSCGTASEVTFPVVANTLYRIRIGGASATTGTGSMVITCTVAGPVCPADVNGDNSVNVTDLLAVIGSWGPCDGCPADINNDDQVNVADLLAVINAWGDCPK